jgi:hypothetical protein
VAKDHRTSGRLEDRIDVQVSKAHFAKRRDAVWVRKDFVLVLEDAGEQIVLQINTSYGLRVFKFERGKLGHFLSVWMRLRARRTIHGW